MESIELIYSEALIKETIRKCWFRQVGVAFFLTLLGITLYTIYLIITGDRSWYVGVIGAVVVIGVITIFFSYIVQVNQALGRLRQMGAPKATFTYSDTLFKISSGVGTSELTWSLITKVVRFENAWVIFFSKNEKMILPTANITEKSKNAILAKLREHKVKIE